VDNAEVIRTLAAMTTDEFEATVAEARGDDPQTRKEAAIKALREYHRLGPKTD